jgi:uncharacterized protein YecT (DUF1311 family)
MVMIRTLCIAALLLVGTPALLAAQDREEFCPARTQSEMTACAAEELARADTLLNERYRQLVRLLAPEPARLQRLREAQRAWIRFRDAECDYEASAFEGGSMQPMIDALCVAGLTKTRADEIQRMILEERERG